MKILLYSEGLKTIGKSGLGKAIKHQMKALEDENIEYTLNPKEDYDILHINTYFLKSYLLAKKAKRLGKKVVYHAHSTEEDFKDGFIFCRQISPLFKKWLIKCYSLGDVIVTPTPYSKKLLEGYGMNRKIYAVSNGIDLSLFKKDPKAGQKFRKEYGYKKNDKVIVGIGLYIERKGIVEFVELAKRLPEYKFIWFGYSPLAAATKPVKDAVNTKLDNLTFAGYVEQDMIKAALNGCDLYLFPTKEETEGIPIIEACAVSCNAIVSDIPIFDGWLKDGKNVYKAKDVDEFEKKIKKFFDGKLKSVAENAYEVAKERDLNNIGKQLKGIYEEVLKMPSKTKEELRQEKSKKIKGISLFISSIILILALFINSNKFDFSLKEYNKDIKYNGYEFNVTISTTSQNKADKVFKELENILKSDLKLLSYSDNELKFIYENDLEDEELVLTSDLYSALKTMDKYYDESNNSLDIYSGSAYELWNQKKYLNELPSIDEINSLNNPEIEFLGNYKIKNNHANLYFESIISGYILNDIEKYLKENDINSYKIVGRDNILLGNYPSKKDKYIIGLPLETLYGNDLIQTIKITNKSIVVKSKYQNYYEYNDNIYSNIIDPKTNMPADKMELVYVIGNDSLFTNILATELFNMTYEEGLEYIKKYQDIDVIWCYLETEDSIVCQKTENFDNY